MCSKYVRSSVPRLGLEPFQPEIKSLERRCGVRGTGWVRYMGNSPLKMEVLICFNRSIMGKYGKHAL